MFKILIIEPFPKIVLSKFRKQNKNYQLIYDPELPPEKLGLTLFSGKFDGLIVGSANISHDVIKQWVAAMPNHQLAIVRAGTNISTIDIKSASTHNIVVMNTAGANSQATAQDIISMILQLADLGKTRKAYQDLLLGKIENKKKYYHMATWDKKIAILGLGNIGIKVASIAKAMDMNVVAYSPSFTEDRAKQMGIKYAKTVNEALESANFVTIQVPYILPGHSTKKPTYKMINQASLELLAEDAMMVSVSRRDVLDMDAILSALETGTLHGFALDTIPYEVLELRKTHPSIFLHQNVVIRPSIATAFYECDVKVASESLLRIKEYFSHKKIIDGINIDRISQSHLQNNSSIYAA